MKKIDPVVLKETTYIAAWTLIFSVLMQAVFLIIGAWDVTVLWGNLLGGGAIVANFFVMAVFVVKALEKEEKESKQTLKLSSSMRFLALFLVVLAGVLLPPFHTYAMLIPLLFPRIAIALRPIFMKNQSSAKKEESNEN